LENFLKTCEEYERRNGQDWVEPTMRPIVDLIETQLPTVTRIMAREEHRNGNVR
jgi:hypothetical protein